MKHLTTALLLALPLPLLAQEPSGEPSPQDSAESPGLPKAPRDHSDPEAVLVTVNGEIIREKDAEARFQLQIQQQTGGMPIPEPQLAGIRDQLWDQIVADLVDDTLLSQEVAAEKITVSDEMALGFLRRSLAAQVSASGKTMEEVSAMIQANRGVDLESFLKEQAASPDLRGTLSQVVLVSKHFPADVAVSDEEVKSAYERDTESRYTRPAQVHARHILIGTDGLTTDAEKAAARKKAEEVLALARAEGADFAALAKAHSTGPSSVSGGDLGFFPRNGAMVEPFAAAAFALEVGGISDVVETQFGYHIIQVVEKQPASVTPLAEAAPWIRDELKLQKVGPLRVKLLAELHEKARIEYPGAPKKS